MLLRGMTLSYASKILGYVVYTGHESKIVKNEGQPVYKTSRIMDRANKNMIFIVLLQAIIALFCGFLAANWAIKNKTGAWYLQYDENMTFGKEWSTRIASWILLCTNFIPISLLVTLELVKFGQKFFIQVDLQMCNPEGGNNAFAGAHSSNLNEELGEVDFVFSDKTGTLTQNVMTFKKFTDGTQAYDADSQEFE
jgi:phospholipid-transporting ATPase